MKILAALLGVSVLLNVALIARRPAAPAEPARRPLAAPKARPAEPSPTSYPDPAEVVVLRERVRQLEAAPQKASPPDVEPPDRVSGFREKLARSLRLLRDSRSYAAAGPEAQLEITELSTELQRARFERWADPRGYVERLGALIELASTETQTPLSEAKRAELRRALEDYELTLSGFSGKDALTRYLQEVGPEADLLKRLKAFASPQVEGKLAAFGAMSPWAPSSAPWVDRAQAEQQLRQTWMSAYGLDEAQGTAVAAAARVYLTAADTLNSQAGRDALPGRESAEWRRRSAQILVDALSSLESSLTPEQRERLRSRRPPELRVYDPNALQRFNR